MAGSLHQDKNTKKWFYMLELGRDETGKRKQKKKGGFKTKTEAKLALAQAEVELSTGTYIEPSKTTLGDYMSEWLEERKHTVRESTYKANLSYFNNHFQPNLGHIKLEDLNAMHVQRMVNKMMSDGMSPTTVNKALCVINLCLKKARKFKLIKENPVPIVDRPKEEKYQTDVWDIEQINEFLQKAKHRYNYIGYLMALSTGMRKGEILGLRWKDVDLENGVVSVQQSLAPSGKKFERGKTKSSIRSIPIPKVLADELKVHYEEYLKLKSSKGKGWNVHDLVICSRTGTPVDPKNFVRGFKLAIKSVGLPEIRFHDLRHSHGTMLLKKNIHPKLVQERLGHSRIGITLDIYSHVLPSMQKEVADTLDNILDIEDVPKAN